MCQQMHVSQLLNGTSRSRLPSSWSVARGARRRVADGHAGVWATHCLPTMWKVRHTDSRRYSRRFFFFFSETFIAPDQLAKYLAVAVDSTGKPVAKRSEIGRFSWDTRNLKSAQNQFPDVSRPEMTCQLRGSVQTRVAEEREIAHAQIRRMLDEQRRILTAECSEKVLHHELLAAQAEQDRKILHEELRQQQEFREARQQDLMRRLELQKFQNSENHKTIMDLCGSLQEQQNEVNLMNDSKDFMDAESICSGNPHVTSPPGLFPRHPPFEGMLKPAFISQRQDEEPPNIWNTSGISGNVFAHPQASSSAPYPLELCSSTWNPWRETTEEPIHKSIAEKSERLERNEDLRCQSGPSAEDSVIFGGGDSSKNYGADQQRLQISDLHFDKFPKPATFLCWKIRFKTEVCTCSQFPTEAMQWIKEVEVVVSVDDLKSSTSIRGIPMPIFAVLDARIASALNKIIHDSHFKTKGPEAGPFPSLQKADCLPDLRLLPGHWSQRFCRELCRLVHYWSSKWW